LIATARFTPHEIELQISRLKPSTIALPGSSPAQKIADTRKQLRQGKRLRKVVVTTLLEPAHAVVNRTAGG